MKAESAFERCLEITKLEAKNFYFGIRLLPPPKRKALSCLYALARQMDDIADGDGTLEFKQKTLGELRQKIKEIAVDDVSGLGENAALWGTYYSAKKYPIPLSALEELLDGCEQDVAPTSYKTFADTETYCRLVAGTVGRLSLSIFGTKEPEVASKLADDLGVALQLTNILRDIKEDHKIGRVYLPLEDLEQFGIGPDLDGSDEAFKELIHFEIDRALGWYEKGFRLLSHLDRRSFACTAAMAGIYFQLLKVIRKDPLAVFRERVSVSDAKKALVVGRSLLKLKPH